MFFHPAIGSLFNDASGTNMYQPFTDWKLLDISIYLRSQRPDSIEVIELTWVEHQIMKRLSILIPSIRYFKGQGCISSNSEYPKLY
jgi:hypothetical protein